MGTEFVPAEDRGEFQVILELPPGTSFDESVATVARVEQAVRRIPEVTQVFSTVGTDGQVRSSTLRVKVTKKDQRERAIGEIKDQVRALLADMAFVDGRVGDPEFMQGAPYEPPINVFIRGDDLAALQRVASEVQAKVSQIPGAVDISSNLESGQPEVVARVNRSIAADLGFSVGTIATQLRGMVEGIVPTRLRDGDREHDIRVRLAPEYRNDPVAVLRTPLVLSERRGRAHQRRRGVLARGRTEQHRPRTAPPAGQDRHRPRARLRARRRDCRGAEGGRVDLDAADL